MSARDLIDRILADFQAIPSAPETNFEHVERNRREAKEAREQAEYLGPDSANSGSDDDWS